MRKNLKKCIGISLAVMTVFSMTACASGSGEKGEGSDSKWVIGYANRDDTDTYLKAVVDEFEKLVEADDTLDIYLADCEGDSQTQLDQIDNFFVQGIDCLIMVPQDGETVVDYVEQCNEEGIPVFCSSQTAAGGEYTFVGASDYDTGYYQGVWAKENLPENAKVLYLGGNLGYQTTIDRRQGMIDGLEERLYSDYDNNVLNEDGDIEIISWQECDYTMDNGMQIMEDWIQGIGEFDAVIGVNDRSSLGAIEALNGAGITDCMVISVDGIEDGLNAVKEGSMACTIMQSAPLQAKALYDAVKTAQEGGSNPEVINPEVITVDAKNVDEYLK